MKAEVTRTTAGVLAVASAGRSHVRWFVLILISLIFMISYIDRANISVTAPAMARELGLSKTQMGFVFSAFVWAYALGQLPGGWLADRFGPKKVLLFIVPFWSLMTAATAWASGALSLFTVRFVFGLGEAGAFPTATRAMQLWFPKRERGFAQGVSHGATNLAVTITPIVSVAIMTAFGWRWVFYSFACVGIAWAALFAVSYRNRPEDHRGVNDAELAYIRDREAGADRPAWVPAARAAVPWAALLSSPNMWFIAGAYACFFYGTYFYVTWFPTYLLEYRHLSLKDIGLLAPVPLIAALIGNVAGGLLTDFVLRKTKRARLARRIVAVPGLLGAAAMLLPAALASDATTAILCLTASNCALGFVVGPAWAVPMDVAGGASGTATAIMNMAGAIGASISPLVFGVLAQQGSWIAPFFVTAGVLLTGAVIWAVLIDPEKSVVGHAAS